jgi:hypothetical protein
VTCWRRTHPHAQNTRRLSTECCVKDARPHSDNVVAIRKIACLGFYFICGFLNDAFSATDYTASNERMIGEWWIVNCGRKRLWFNFTGIWLEGLRKTTTTSVRMSGLRDLPGSVNHSELEADCLKTDVRFRSSVDTVERHEVVRGPSVGIGPVLMRYRVSVSTTLPLRHLHWLTGVRTVRGRPAFTSAVGVTLPVLRRR